MLSLHEMFGRAGKRQKDIHILDEHEIADGIDELGVLLYGHKKNAYWYGSQLSIDETRELAPYQNATGLQVTSAVLAGMVWALENPNAGIVEADEMDFRRCLEVQMPYLGPVIGSLHRLDAARRPARPVPGRHRQARPLAVQERAGALSRPASRRARDTSKTQKLTRGIHHAVDARAPCARKIVDSRSQLDYFGHCPFSHVPVAVCRSVGIRTRGRTAA